MSALQAYLSKEVHPMYAIFVPVSAPDLNIAWLATVLYVAKLYVPREKMSVTSPGNVSMSQTSSEIPRHVLFEGCSAAETGQC